MCGIHLIFDKKGQLDAHPISQMMQNTRHRGPDHETFCQVQFSNSQLFIGHNRLKIIDLSNQANQPWVSQDKRYILSYNGEIYNYLSLKKNLSAHYPFQSQSDSEVLLYYLIHHQINSPKSLKTALDALQGMYAFIFLDTQARNLILARDPLGIKPLYYYEDEKYLIVSSEMKGILQSGLVRKQLNASQIYPYLQFRFAQSPATFYENIYQISSPQILNFSNPAQIQWDSLPEPSPDFSKKISQSPQDLIHSLEKIFLKTLEQQAQADVPLGIFLSGGVDSTLLLAGLRELGHKSIPTFSITYSKNSFGTQDTHYARLAAQEYEAAHQEVSIGSEILEDLSAFVKTLDQPIGDGAALLTYHLSQVARKSVKVILSGAGADELFAGYNRHQAFYKFLQYRSWLSYVGGAKKLASLPEGWQHPWRKTFRLVNRFLSKFEPHSPAQTFINFTSLDTSQILAEHWIQSSNEIWPKQLEDKEAWLRTALYYDRRHFLSQDVLALTDAMSMQHSLEIRVPYLDQGLVNWLDQIPSTQLLAKGQKWLLKALLNKKNGKVFSQRKKEGFGMPFGQWLKEPVGNPWKLYLIDKKSYLWEFISHQAVKEMLKAHVKHQHDYSSELWTVLILALWLDVHFS